MPDWEENILRLEEQVIRSDERTDAKEKLARREWSKLLVKRLLNSNANRLIDLMVSRLVTRLTDFGIEVESNCFGGVYPYPSFNGFSIQGKEGGYLIFVNNNLVKLSNAFASIVHSPATVEERADGLGELVDVACSESGTIDPRRWRHGESNVYDIASSARGIIKFVLLHELGHATSADQGYAVSPSPPRKITSSLPHEKEFEADKWAVDSTVTLVRRG